MKFFLQSCKRCDFAETQRVQRTWWMRLLPGYRHYHCAICEQTLLARKEIVEERPWRTTTVKTPRPLRRSKPSGK